MLPYSVRCRPMRASKSPLQTDRHTQVVTQRKDQRFDTVFFYMSKFPTLVKKTELSQGKKNFPWRCSRLGRTKLEAGKSYLGFVGGMQLLLGRPTVVASPSLAESALKVLSGEKFLPPPRRRRE